MIATTTPTDASLDTEKILAERRTFSTEKISEIANELGEIPSDCCVAVTASFGRLEAGGASDFDYFMLTKNKSTEVDQLKEKLKATIAKKVGKLPSPDGAFAEVALADDMLQNIGGKEETNGDLTRRMLFLIEGRPVSGAAYFEDVRKEILRRYISEQIKAHQLGLFFLNDLIRYYRTICVDFEHKTVEQGKSWGDRNIKLVFSRKLIYFAGVLIAAEMAQRTYQEKLEVAEFLMGLTPVDRIRKVCGPTADRAIDYYASFVDSMQTAQVRDMLTKVTSDRRSHPEEFMRMKNSGQHFTWHLLSALQATYHETHPIHKSLVI